jgi:hypothetical protein
MLLAQDKGMGRIDRAETWAAEALRLSLISQTMEDEEDSR